MCDTVLPANRAAPRYSSAAAGLTTAPIASVRVTRSRDRRRIGCCRARHVGARLRGRRTPVGHEPRERALNGHGRPSGARASGRSQPGRRAEARTDLDPEPGARLPLQCSTRSRDPLLEYVVVVPAQRLGSGQSAWSGGIVCGFPGACSTPCRSARSSSPLETSCEPPWVA
jgi:hypothetical protein